MAVSRTETRLRTAWNLRDKMLQFQGRSEGRVKMCGVGPLGVGMLLTAPACAVH